MVTRYRIYSSVTGEMLTEIDAAGQKMETHVYSIGGQEYRQIKAYAIKTSSTQFTNYPEQIVQEYSDPKGTRAHQWDREKNTSKDVHMSPVGVANTAIDWQDLKNRFVNNIAGQLSYAASQAHYPGTRSQLEDPLNPGRGCELDGKSVSCSKVIKEFNRGWVTFSHQQFREFEEHPSTAPGLIVSRGVEGNSADEILTGLDDIDVSIEGPGGTPAKVKKPPCTIEILARRISAPGGLEGYAHQSTLYHTYILVSGAERPTTVFSAFPGELIGLKDREGLLTPTEKLYKEGSRDFDKSKSEGGTLYGSTTITDNCEDIFSSFRSVSQKVNDANIAYPGYASQAVGSNQNNSNAYVFTLLSDRYGDKIARRTVGSLFDGNPNILIPGIKTRLPIK